MIFECKKYCTCTKNDSWNPSTCICGNGKYLKSIADTLVSVYNEITNAKDDVSTNLTDTIPTNHDKYYINKCHEY